MLSILLKYNRDKLFERMSKLKNVSTTKTKKTRSSHHKSLAISLSYINVKGANLWEVSSKNNMQIYTVEKNLQPLCVTCHLKCDKCNICVHMYKCACKDNVIMSNICKHIHACHRLFNIIDDSSVIEQDDINELKIDEFFSTYCPTDSVKSDKNVEIVKRKIELFQSQLTQNSLTAENCNRINHHLDQLLMLINTIPNSDFKPPDSNLGEPSNKKIKQQVRFESTKKKRKNKTDVSLSNPLPGEAMSIVERLMDPTQDTLYIHSGFDHIY